MCIIDDVCKKSVLQSKLRCYSVVKQSNEWMEGIIRITTKPYRLDSQDLFTKKNVQTSRNIGGNRRVDQFFVQSVLKEDFIFIGQWMIKSLYFMSLPGAFHNFIHCGDDNLASWPVGVGADTSMLPWYMSRSATEPTRVTMFYY